MNSDTGISNWQEAKDLWGTLIYTHPGCKSEVGGVFRPALDLYVAGHLMGFFKQPVTLSAFDKYELGGLLADVDTVVSKSQGECKDHYNLLMDVILFAIQWNGEGSE